jgi:hypothetical protein
VSRTKGKPKLSIAPPKPGGLSSRRQPCRSGLINCLVPAPVVEHLNLVFTSRRHDNREVGCFVCLMHVGGILTLNVIQKT